VLLIGWLPQRPEDEFGPFARLSADSISSDGGLHTAGLQVPRNQDQRGKLMTMQRIKDVSIILMVLSVTVLCVVLILVVIGLYPAANDAMSNLSDATASLNRALNDIETAAESFVEFSSVLLEELK
jgi:Mn2+/Fe2+ NRAMP family transporter